MSFQPNARPVDVAILYGLGQKDRAQHLARELRPPEGWDAGFDVDADDLLVKLHD